ncbi:hypothetical protein, partial [Streptomyces lavendulae]|uniref:hypothetical protein n=1 Tax=Streptomyces lavendulae TaxID=1914 RepID=UPI0036ECE9F7
LPPHLQRVEPRPGGYGLRYVLAPVTGREPQPTEPTTHEDPKLRHVQEKDDEREYWLRLKAGVVLADIYRQARDEWRIAAYVADLRDVVQDGPVLWAAYQDAAKALTAAYAYLRTPQAAAEWPSALSRLLDAQDHVQQAADAFDVRALDIARVRDEHLYADIGHDAAMEAAGYPEASGWHITDARLYHETRYSEWCTPPLAEQVRRLIAQQEEHVAKISRLSGTAG